MISGIYETINLSCFVVVNEHAEIRIENLFNDQLEELLRDTALVYAYGCYRKGKEIDAYYGF